MMRFNFFKERKEEPVKVLELFGGIGACTQAFKRVGVPFEVVDYVEIDKYACKSYNAINGTDFKPQDICEWDKDIKVDFIMHGSPCQDFSVAGKGLGGDEGSGTRSSLMYETIRIVEKLKPKYVLWENVKNVTGKKHRHNFDKYLVSLQQLGYNNYWQIMNAKDYGIPQNRERVFVLSIRRDIDNGYEFPEPFPLQLRLKDMLDDDVDESFYISDERTKSLQRDLINKDTLMLDVCQYKREGHPREYNEVSPTLSARDYKDPRLIQVGNLDIKGQDIVKRVYSSDGLSPTLTNMQGGNRQPKVAVAMRGRYNDDGEVEQQLEISDREYANSITTVQKDSMVAEVQTVGRINSSQDGIVIDPNGISPTHTAGHGNTPKVIVREATKKGYAEAEVGDSINLEQPNSKTRRGRVGKQVAQTLTTSPQQAVVLDE